MVKRILRSWRAMVGTALIVSMLAASVPARTYAVLGAGDTVIITADTSLTGIENFINLEMDHLKNFVLDHLAVVLAKQILHQLTVSVVNWINSGFKGSPAFLTNPQAFFLDVADQVTGAFLATNGPLASLCSPFNIDIRLSLALNQTALANQRYTCTLSKIIQTQKNGPSITVNGKTVRTSQGTMTGFLGGDFSQGGWPAFMTLTTQPQNNPYGASLYAQGDLYAQIGAKQNTVHADLQLGSGFMSWQSCQDIPGGTVDPNNEDQVAEADAIVGDATNVSTRNNSDGTMTYQTCETQTPGSVISGTLQKNLNVPVEELELANDINAVINALFTQMVNTMLTGGLHALSGGGSSGSNGSYTQQVINDAKSSQALTADVNSLQAAVSPAIDQVNAYKSSYDQAVGLISDSKNKYLAAKACFTDRRSNYGNGGIFNSDFDSQEMVNIDNAIQTQVDPLLTDLTAKQTSATADLTKLQNISYSLSGTGSAEQIKAQAQQYADFVQNGGLYNQSKIDAASAALSNAQVQAQRFNSDAAQFQKDCNNQ